MKYKAIIFDLDGTLLDTLEDIADSMNSVLKHLGFPKHNLNAYKYFVGEGLERLVRRVLPEDKLEEGLVAQCIGRMRDEYRKRWADKTHPYPEVPELLDALSIRGVKLAILSNKPDDFTKVIVAKFLPHWKFVSILGANDAMPKKPDPTAALTIAETLNIPPHECLFLGDSNIDMETAQAAGMYPVGALWGFRTAEELTESGAKSLVEKPTELLKLL